MLETLFIKLGSQKAFQYLILVTINPSFGVQVIKCYSTYSHRWRFLSVCWLSGPLPFPGAPYRVLPVRIQNPTKKDAFDRILPSLRRWCSSKLSRTGMCVGMIWITFLYCELRLSCELILWFFGLHYGFHSCHELLNGPLGNYRSRNEIITVVRRKNRCAYSHCKN